MTAKNKIVLTLEENKGDCISGQKLADISGISRAGVWKNIKLLKEQGYKIKTLPNKGYMLESDSDVVSEHGIRNFLNSHCPIIEVYDTIDSTNSLALKRAEDLKEKNCIFVANQQTNGRGRIGRTFESPQGGVYFSLLIRPDLDFLDAMLITPAVAVSVAQVMENSCKINPKIKWVNDIYFKGKKVCGISSQATTDIESGKISSVVVGIGINYITQSSDFSKDLQDKAGSIYEFETPTITRNQLIAEIVDNFIAIVDKIKDRAFMQEYRRFSLVVGKDIKYVYNNQQMSGIVKQIDNDGGLIIENKDGIMRLSCGEISINVDKKWL